MATQFPFGLDFGKMAETFKAPAFDFGSLQAAQEKNIAAVMQANKTALQGYQAIYKRQTELFEAAMAEAKDKFGAAQGKPVSAETATEAFETMKSAFEKSMTDLKGMAEMAQAANTEAFEIVKARAEEAFAEMKDAADKMAA